MRKRGGAREVLRGEENQEWQEDKENRVGKNLHSEDDWIRRDENAFFCHKTNEREVTERRACRLSGKTKGRGTRPKKKAQTKKPEFYKDREDGVRSER